MKIENQVCTLEQAKRLNDLGIIQGLSSFFWDTYVGEIGLKFNSTPEDGYMPAPHNTCFSAFSVAELGVMLGTDNWSTNYKRQNVFYWDAELYSAPFGPYPTESEARAAILIWLLENGRFTAEDVNQRLQAK